MKILHITESLEFGGAEMVVIELANAMSEKHLVEVLCLKRIGALSARLRDTIACRCLEKPEGTECRTLVKIARFVRQGGYDVVHTHNWGTFFDGVIGASWGGSPVIVHTAHGNFLQYSGTLWGRSKCLIRRSLDRLAARRAHRIVTVSELIREQIANTLHVPQDKLCTIYNGVTVFEEEVPRRERPDPASIVFIAVGRLAAVKNYKILLEAFAIASAHSRVPLCLQLVGDGPERKKLEELAGTFGIQHAVTFFGFRDDIPSLLASADVFMLTSHYEGVSVALLEAMRSALPVVATRVGGNVEVVQTDITGILVPDNDANECAQAMIHLACAPEIRRAMGIAAKARIKEVFNFEQTVMRYLDLYDSLASANCAS